ncbi:MAG: hypothetical protein AAF943_17180 [Pseudomonadota bacterium]
MTAKKLKAVLGLGTATLILSTSVTSAASVTNIDETVNTFANGGFTGGAEAIVDARGSTPIGAGVDLVSVGGVYDVDVTDNSVTMTFTASLSNLVITNYDATTFDRYYFEFDKALKAAAITAAASGFAATVDVLTPGSMISTLDLFNTGLATDRTFENGGILVTIGEGTDLTQLVGGGQLSVRVSPVPLPAPMALLGFTIMGLGALGARRASRKL